MDFRNTTLLIAGVVLLQSAVLAAQEPRPALIPQATGGGPPGSANSTSAGSIGSLSDGPILAGETVHINVFDAPDFSFVTRVSESGDVPFPILGSFHIAGLNSAKAASQLARELKDRNLMLDPEVTVTVDSTATGITVLGEVHSPGIYPPPGKRQLSDLLATAGGLTANTGRIIEITSDANPGKKEYVSWDPTISVSSWPKRWRVPHPCLSATRSTSGVRCRLRDPDWSSRTHSKERATLFAASMRSRRRSANKWHATRGRVFCATSISKLLRRDSGGPSAWKKKPLPVRDSHQRTDSISRTHLGTGNSV